MPTGHAKLELEPQRGMGEKKTNRQWHIQAQQEGKGSDFSTIDKGRTCVGIRPASQEDPVDERT